jgi:hypothetical protein
MAIAQTSETVEERAARLELRLQDGFTRIGQMMAQGIAVEHWEDAWVRILREYESLETEIAAHHAEGQPMRQETLMTVAVEREVR